MEEALVIVQAGVQGIRDICSLRFTVGKLTQYRGELIAFMSAYMLMRVYLRGYATTYNGSAVSNMSCSLDTGKFRSPCASSSTPIKAAHRQTNAHWNWA